ncbi:hypothetical protein C9374_011559 [Naegleria lovaniensis]|uniref:Uncharacterized protein n=1 Tax=Naegleria lovaniensis TaxID=51637 RepID=A0AA88GYC7_NAELO|nr:uncharacterized protein C9374_011559 [Naegleria lovaniensis]KAG2392834.1 hypothetical protein C9374_011559 [Naegleria lovaniensis]
MSSSIVGTSSNETLSNNPNPISIVVNGPPSTKTTEQQLWTEDYDGMLEMVDFKALKDQFSSHNLVSVSSSVLLDTEKLITTINILLETVEKQDRNIRALAKAIPKTSSSLYRVQPESTRARESPDMQQKPSRPSIQDDQKPTKSATPPPRIVEKETIVVKEDDPFLKNQLHNLNNEFAVIQEEHLQHQTRLTELEEIVQEQLTQEKMKVEMKIDEAKEMINVLKFDKEELLRQMVKLREDMKLSIDEATGEINHEIRSIIQTLDVHVTTLRDEYRTLISTNTTDLQGKIDAISQKLGQTMDNFKERTDSQRNDIEELKYRVTKTEENFTRKLEHLTEKMEKNFRLLEKDVLKTNYVANLIYDVFQLDKQTVTELPDTYVQEKFQLKEDIGRYSKMRNQKNRQELRKIYTDMLLVTPSFKTVAENATNSLNEVRWELSSRMDRESDRVHEDVDDIRENMKRFVTYPELKASITENEVIKKVVTDVEKHESSIQNFVSNYLNREEVWEALRQKADEKNMELKADRKIVNGLFDYLNEKLNTILGKNTTEEMMEAIKNLEQKLQNKADRQELVDSHHTVYPPNIINIIRKDIVPDDLIVGMGLPQPFLMAKGEMETKTTSGYKCLSCNRPFTKQPIHGACSSTGNSPPRRQVPQQPSMPSQQQQGAMPPQPVTSTVISSTIVNLPQTTCTEEETPSQPNSSLTTNPSQIQTATTPNLNQPPSQGQDLSKPSNEVNEPASARVRTEPPLLPPASPSDFFDIPKLNLKKVLKPPDYDNPIFRYSLKASSRSVEEEMLEHTSDRMNEHDNNNNTQERPDTNHSTLSDIEQKPPSQMFDIHMPMTSNFEDSQSNELRPKPPRSAPLQMSFSRYSVRSLNNDTSTTTTPSQPLTPKLVMTARDKENAFSFNSTALMRPFSAKETSRSSRNNFSLNAVVGGPNKQQNESTNPISNPNPSSSTSSSSGNFRQLLVIKPANNKRDNRFPKIK